MAKIANLSTRSPHVKGVSLVHSNTVSLHSSNTLPLVDHLETCADAPTMSIVVSLAANS